MDNSEPIQNPTPENPEFRFEPAPPPAPETPAEVFPEAQIAEEVRPVSVDPAFSFAGAAATQANNSVESWLVKNIAPLLIIFLSLTLSVVVELLPQQRPKRVRTPNLPNPTAKSPTAEQKTQAAENPQTPTAEEASEQLLFPLLGMAAFVVLVFRAIPDIRKWVGYVLRRITIRTLPAVRGADFIATVLVYFTIARIAVVLILSQLTEESVSFQAYALIANAIGLSSALVTVVWLSRVRARGIHGSFGIWPFWKLARKAGDRDVWWDIGLGVLSCPVGFWLIAVSSVVNHWFIRVIGQQQDNHILVTELAEPQPRWVIGIIFITAVAGAAFFEEILFRGLLYNVLRRYFGAVAGAIISAAIFSAAHGIKSQFLPLFMLGLLLTWLYDNTGRLISSMTLHATNNLVVLTLTLLSQRNV